MNSPVLTLTAVTASAAIALAATATGASAMPVAATSASSAPQAYIRAAHLSPTTPGVDVYLTSFAGKATRLWVAGEKYGAVSPYIATPPGLYTVAMRPHGESAAHPAMLSWTLQARAGGAYTAAAVGSASASGAVRGTVFDDDLTTPAAGKGRVRLIQAANLAPQATVVAVAGPVVAQNAAFATATGYAQVSAGTWPLEAASVQNPALRTTGSVSVPAGSVTSIVLLDRPDGGLRLETVLDAAAAVTMPKGAVHAGEGGTATVVIDRTSLWTSLWERRVPTALLALLAASASVWFARRRRASR